MKKLNTFVILGITGIIITGAIHIGLVIFKEIEFSYMFNFYIVWFVLFTIGLGQLKRNQKKKLIEN